MSQSNAIDAMNEIALSLNFFFFFIVFIADQWHDLPDGNRFVHFPFITQNDELNGQNTNRKKSKEEKNRNRNIRESSSSKTRGQNLITHKFRIDYRNGKQKKRTTIKRKRTHTRTKNIMRMTRKNKRMEESKPKKKLKEIYIKMNREQFKHE